MLPFWLGSYSRLRKGIYIFEMYWIFLGPKCKFYNHIREHYKNTLKNVALILSLPISLHKIPFDVPHNCGSCPLNQCTVPLNRPSSHHCPSGAKSSMYIRFKYVKMSAGNQTVLILKAQTQLTQASIVIWLSPTALSKLSISLTSKVQTAEYVLY